MAVRVQSSLEYNERTLTPRSGFFMKRSGIKTGLVTAAAEGRYPPSVQSLFNFWRGFFVDPNSQKTQSLFPNNIPIALLVDPPERTVRYGRARWT